MTMISKAEEEDRPKPLVKELQCEYMFNPVGLDRREPGLSWMILESGRNHWQSAFRIRIFRKEGKGEKTLLDTGRIESRRSFYVAERLPLESSERYFWRVKVWDEEDRESEWSEEAFFEIGLLNEEDWKDADWVEPDQRPEPLITQEEVDFHIYPDLHDEERFVPSLILIRTFRVSGEVRRARTYVSAHGMYRLSVNGRRIGTYELAPEPTPYDKYIQYQTYDIGEYLRHGENELAIHLAPGWWSGVIGLKSSSCQYGDTMAAIMKTEIRYRDGRVEIIASDRRMQAYEGPYHYAELYMGECYDASREGKRDRPLGIRLMPYDKSVLRGQNAPHIHIVKEVKLQKIFVSPHGETLLDFGEEMAGKARIAFTAARGTAVRFHYFQQLDRNGNYQLGIHNDYNQMTDTYIPDETGPVIYEPSFVYRGFRYVWAEGCLAIDPARTVGLMMSSVERTSGFFECSDSRVNRLSENIRRTAAANYFGIPTDNPDRERAGWTGDSQIFFEAGSFITETKAFFRRWLEMMRLEQEENGNIPLVVPYWASYRKMKHHKGDAGGLPNSSAWGDACVIVPWLFYLQYGDERILSENLDMMLKWMGLVRQTVENLNPEAENGADPERRKKLQYLWNMGFHYGDWLTPSTCTDANGDFLYLPSSLPLQSFTPHCYYAYTNEIMGKILSILGRGKEGEAYSRRSLKIREAAFSELFDEQGHPKEGRQGALVLGVQFGIVPDALRKPVLDRLCNRIEENGGRMDTGFSSTQFILEVLAEHGYLREAYDLLFCNRMPSWLYEVEKGATSVWESWQAITPDGTVNPVSFIQYANGTVESFMFKTIAGIRSLTPGYRTVCICPEPDERLDYARAVYRTLQGEIVSAWKRENGWMMIDVVIPCNTEAYIYLPHAKLEEIREGAERTDRLEGMPAEQKENKVLITCGSGEYRFSYPIAE